MDRLFLRSIIHLIPRRCCPEVAERAMQEQTQDRWRGSGWGLSAAVVMGRLEPIMWGRRHTHHEPPVVSPLPSTWGGRCMRNLHGTDDVLKYVYWYHPASLCRSRLLGWRSQLDPSL